MRSCLCSFRCDRGPRFVEIEDLSLELSVGTLDSARLGDASDLQRLEAGHPDEPLGRGLGGIVVGGVEENDPWVAVRAGRELLDGAESPERLDVVRARR